MPVVNRIAEFSAEMTAWRRHLHTIPELGQDCFETAAFVAERLREFGVDELHEGIARTGIVAIIQGRGDGPTVGLRAEGLDRSVDSRGLRRVGLQYSNPDEDSGSDQGRALGGVSGHAELDDGNCALSLLRQIHYTIVLASTCE